MTGPSLTGAQALLVALKSAGVDYLLADAGTDFPPIIEAFEERRQALLDVIPPY